MPTNDRDPQQHPHAFCGPSLGRVKFCPRPQRGPNHPQNEISKDKRKKVIEIRWNGLGEMNHLENVQNCLARKIPNLSR